VTAPVHFREPNRALLEKDDYERLHAVFVPDDSVLAKTGASYFLLILFRLFERRCGDHLGVRFV
jgi:hypothetical protein